MPDRVVDAPPGPRVHRFLGRQRHRQRSRSPAGKVGIPDQPDVIVNPDGVSLGTVARGILRRIPAFRVAPLSPRAVNVPPLVVEIAQGPPE